MSALSDADRRWVARQIDAASLAASAEWGPGWKSLTHEMRRAFVAAKALALISGGDESGDSPERCRRWRAMADEILTCEDWL